MSVELFMIGLICAQGHQIEEETEKRQITSVNLSIITDEKIVLVMWRETEKEKARTIFLFLFYDCVYSPIET